MARSRSLSTSRAREHDWFIAILSYIVAVAALAVGSDYGKIHGPSEHKHIIAWACAALLLLAGTVAVRRTAAALDHLIAKRSTRAAGAAIRLLVSGVGYVVLIFCVFAALGFSAQRLLIGAGLAGVVLGIAAQQSLGNIFASLVLLVARPFGVGDRIRIRSGTLGVLDVNVVSIGLTYVTVRTDDGELKIPNSVMLAAGIGQFKPAPEPSEPAPESSTTAPEPSAQVEPEPDPAPDDPT
jgi:small-conductance mechanosensitive channel